MACQLGNSYCTCIYGRGIRNSASCPTVSHQVQGATEIVGTVVVHTRMQASVRMPLSNDRHIHEWLDYFEFSIFEILSKSGDPDLVLQNPVDL
jgi:hypothetical protein